MPSPTPKKQHVLLDFSQAIRKIAEGKKVTRIDWGTDNIYGELKNEILILHKDNQDYQWIISEGDIMAIDWIVL